MLPASAEPSQPRHTTNTQISMLLVFAVPVAQRILGWVAQLADLRLNALAKLDIKLTSHSQKSYEAFSPGVVGPAYRVAALC
ncbi:hypothetical protein ASC96_30505 [Rhizobium sp. Root1204]|nr:hypothetical protein ASC96_30505 [Rhizobium sp. Root1204]